MAQQTVSSLFNNFVSSLTPKKPVTSTPFYPTPTGNSPKALVTAPVVPSNVAATTTKPTTITPPVIKTPAAQQYVNGLTQAQVQQGYSTISGAYDPVTGKLKSGQTTPTTPNNGGYSTIEGPYDPTTGNLKSGSDSTAPTGPAPYQPPDTSASDAAYAAYLKSLLPSDEETAAKKKYLDFQNQTQNTLQGISEQVIPRGFITGQQASVADRANIEGNRLQGDVSLAQENRGITSTAAKAGLDYELSKNQIAAKAKQDAITNNKPFDVGDHTYIYNPTTGQYEDKGLNTAPATSGAAAGFTLSPGENRYDATGKLIASGGAKPMTQAQETAALAKTDKEVVAQQSAAQSIGLVNDLLNSNTDAITGVGQNPLNYLGVSNSKAINQYDQLQGLLKLGIRGLLKGQGAVSDYEGKILGQAASALGRNLSNADFKEALQKIRGTLKTNNGQTTTVNVTNPQTGETIQGAELSGAEIYHLVSEGNLIDYQ